MDRAAPSPASGRRPYNGLVDGAGDTPCGARMGGALGSSSGPPFAPQWLLPRTPPHGRPPGAA
ncbi:hypothetical protein IBTHAUMO2_1060004 [Nitrosopumilaceae archaeon]|nr:hypothetical protein IBTHAUMO2_1060004 [Nitrosopumilaceae archaeon]